MGGGGLGKIGTGLGPGSRGPVLFVFMTVPIGAGAQNHKRHVDRCSVQRWRSQPTGGFADPPAATGVMLIYDCRLAAFIAE